MKSQLAEAQDDLNATKHQHSIDMQLQELDDLEREIDKTYDRNLEALEEHVDRQEEMIDNMLGNVINKYDGAYSQINDIINKTNLSIKDSFKELNEYLDSAGSTQENTSASNSNQSQSGSSTGSGSSGSSSSGNSSSDTSKYEEQLKQPENTTNRPVAAIILDKTSISVNEGVSKTVKVKEIKPSDAANQNVKWKSSDTKIATVSGGKIKGVKVGSCTVTCTAADGNGANATVTVTVKATTQVDSSGINAEANDTKPTTNNNNPSNNSSGSDNKITKGEKVTFDNGKYTAASDGSGSSGKQSLGEKVYVTKIKSGAERPYHIAKKKDGSGALGWVKKSQLKGYATGTKYIDENQLAWLNEHENLESIIRQRDGAVLRVMEKGDRILNSKSTANLYDMANNPAKYFAENIGLNNISSISAVRDIGSSISNHYDSLLTVNGNIDKNVLPELKELLEKAYQYTSQQLTKDAKKLGIRGLR